jgi:hypothetical protein
MLEELRDLSEAQIAERLLSLSRELGAAGSRLADAIGERFFALATEEQRMQLV